MKTIPAAYPDLSFEQSLWQSGVQRLAGLDEAGRGAWAGPVAAAAVILPQTAQIQADLAGVRDSKQMTPKQRTHWAERIKTTARAWGVGFASQVEIDTLGIVAATRLAMHRALDVLSVAPQHLLLDALALPQNTLPQTALIKGDSRCLSIAAASVLAKTARDQLMANLDGQYPGYGFSHHKGYGTAVHRAALQLHGPCTEHRMSFAPLKKLA